MKFDDLDAKMRVYETAHDHCILPGIYLASRIDGRSFTRLTKELHKFEAPFDERVRDMMLLTTEHLMDCGFKVIYGFTQSDEISLLFHPQEDSFGRKLRKYHSVLAGEASATFSLALGSQAVFDCRISQLPNANLVVDYFRWRQEDAHRNALSAHSYWCLRREGKNEREATKAIEGLGVPEKNELLFKRGINFNDLPSWQKRGSGLYWESYQKEGQNPVTGKTELAARRRIKRDFELPVGEPYGQFIAKLLAQYSDT